MKTDTVVFDLGGVLIDWKPEYLYRKLFKTEDEVSRFLSEVCTLEWNEEQDGGRTIAEGTQQLIAQFPEHEPYIRAYYDRWEEMLGGVIHATVEILEEIHAKKTFRLFALTNWSAETWPVALEKFPFLSTFQDVLVSGREGLKKPDLKIYELMFQKFSINPEKAIFIDDNIRNINAAEKSGLYSIHFSNPILLRKELVQLGIL
jgi:2-haloacid dehalogenase